MTPTTSNVGTTGPSGVLPSISRPGRPPHLIGGLTYGVGLIRRPGGGWMP